MTAIAWDTTYEHLGLHVGTVTLVGDTSDDNSDIFADYDGSGPGHGKFRVCCVYATGAATQYDTLTIQTVGGGVATGVVMPALAGQIVQPVIGAAASNKAGIVNLEKTGFGGHYLDATGGTGAQSVAVTILLWK